MSDLQDPSNGDLTSTPDAVLGDPLATGLVFCNKCGGLRPFEAMPSGQQKCSVCGTFVAVTRAKHRVSEARIQTVQHELERSFPSSDALGKDNRRQLARLLVEREHVRVGTPAYSRLIDQAATLEGQIRAEARSSDTVAERLASLSPEDLHAHTVALQERARKLLLLRTATPAAPPPPDRIAAGARALELLDRVAAGEELTPDEERELAECEALALSTTPTFDSPVVLTPSEPDRTSTLQPVEPATCIFCSQPLTRCIELKSENLATWRVLHGNDPAEIQRRADEATTEMMHQLGKPNPWG